MMAGSLGLLHETADEILSDYNSGGFDTLEVSETQEYLDGETIQNGRAASLVEMTREEIWIEDGSIEVEETASDQRVWTDWLADVTGEGFVLAERTHGGGDFPFNMFWARSGVPVEAAEIDTATFIENQQDPDVWYTGADGVTEVEMDYHDAASLDGTPPNIGVGFETPWQGTAVRGVIYSSGYIAVYSPSSWGPMQFGRFVADEVAPVAYIPDEEGDDA